MKDFILQEEVFWLLILAGLVAAVVWYVVSKRKKDRDRGHASDYS